MPAPSEQDVRIDAMVQRNSGDRSARHQRELNQVAFERAVVMTSLGRFAQQRAIGLQCLHGVHYPR